MKRGTDFGPTLTPAMASIGLPVRVTASNGLLAGQRGKIEAIDRQSVLVRFSDAFAHYIEMRRLQVVRVELSQAQLDVVEATEKKELFNHPWDSTSTQVPEPVLLPARVVVATKPEEPMFREDAYWNF